MWHTAFIALHAALGVVAFGAGVAALTRRRPFGFYLWSLAGMAIALVLAVAAEWEVLDAASRILFAALITLAAYMVWRGFRARATRPTPAEPPSAGYLDHVGFTLVGLADAFIVVSVFRLGVPGPAVAVIGVGIAIAGHLFLRRLSGKLAAPVRTERRAGSPA